MLENEALLHMKKMDTTVKIIEKLGVEAYVPEESLSAPFCSHGKFIFIM